jgi:hypothetical protein
MLLTEGMRVNKQKRRRHLSLDNGQGALVDLPLEFEGRRVFVLWDLVVLGRHQFKARIEIDPKLLERSNGPGGSYTYRGHLVLPRPQDN